MATPFLFFKTLTGFGFQFNGNFDIAIWGMLCTSQMAQNPASRPSTLLAQALHFLPIYQLREYLQALA